MRPNHNLYPPGGYVSQLPGGPFSGNSWQHVSDKISRHRKANRMALGDPEQEVNTEFCLRYPRYCNAASLVALPNAKTSKRHREKSFSNRVLAWLAMVFSKTFMSAIPLAGKAEANRRAEICVSCSQQKAREVGCATCGGNYKLVSEGIKKRVPGVHPELLCCQVLGEDTSISVGLNQRLVKNGELPEFCWRREAI